MAKGDERIVMKVSIIIPCFNAAKFIKDSIDSLLNQNISNIEMEIIVVDDGSTDDTVNVINKYYSNNKIVKLIKKKHSGVVRTVEMGLKVASGEFIALQGADDLSHPDRIKTQVDLLQIDNVVLTYSDLTIIDENGNIIAPSFWDYFDIKPQKGKPVKELLNGNFISGGTMMFKKELVKKILPIPSMLPYEDYWIAFLASLYYSINYCEKPLVMYRKHFNNINLDLNIEKSFYKKIMKKLEYLFYKAFLLREYYTYKLRVK